MQEFEEANLANQEKKKSCESELRKTEHMIRKKEEELKRIQGAIEEKLNVLNKKRREKIASAKRGNESGEDRIKQQSFQYSVNLLAKDYVYNKLSEEIEDFYGWMKLQAGKDKGYRERLIGDIRRFINYYDPSLGV